MKMQVIAARTKERTTAGPASATRVGEADEDAGADDGSYAEAHELEQPHGALEAVPLQVGAGFGDQLVGALDAQAGPGRQARRAERTHGAISSLVEHVGGSCGRSGWGAPVLRSCGGTARKWGSSVRARTPPSGTMVATSSHVHPIGRMIMRCSAPLAVPGQAPARVATRTALIVCIRFSASSKTTECADSKTSSVTSSESRPWLLVDLAADLGARGRGRPGRQCRNLTSGVAGGPQDVHGHGVRRERRDALVPDLLGLTHGDPDVGGDEVGARGRPRRCPR